METLPATILVVEDHTSTRRFLADNLAADGYEPLEAASVADARALIETRFPDLSIVDLRLPDGSGLDLIRPIRALETSQRAAPQAVAMRLRQRFSSRSCKNFFARFLAETVSTPRNGRRRESSRRRSRHFLTSRSSHLLANRNSCARRKKLAN